MFVYKVVEIKQKSMIRGFMTASDLQNAINLWANVGWTLDRLTSGETAGFLGGKDVFLIIFKKEVSVPNDLFVMIDNQSVLLSEHSLPPLKINRKISPDTLACFKGMDNWKPLSQIAPSLIDVLIH